VTVEHRVMTAVRTPPGRTSVVVAALVVALGAALGACGDAPTAEGRIGAVTSAPRADGAPDLPGSGSPVATNPDGTPVLGGTTGGGDGAAGGRAGAAGGRGAASAADGPDGAGGTGSGAKGGQGAASGGGSGGASGPAPAPFPAPPSGIVPTSLSGFRTENMAEDDARAIGGFFGARSALVRWFVANEPTRAEVPTIMVFRDMSPAKRAELVGAPVATDVTVAGRPMRRTVFDIPPRYGIPIVPGREPVAYVWEKSSEYVVLVTGAPDDVLIGLMEKITAL
jgi:hypothetical protein